LDNLERLLIGVLDGSSADGPSAFRKRDIRNAIQEAAGGVLSEEELVVAEGLVSAKYTQLKLAVMRDLRTAKEAIDSIRVDQIRKKTEEEIG
jgi:hypothetical protein